MADSSKTEEHECHFVDGPAKGEWWKVSRHYSLIEVPEREFGISSWIPEKGGREPRVRIVRYRRIGTTNRFAVESYGEWQSPLGANLQNQ